MLLFGLGVGMVMFVIGFSCGAFWTAFHLDKKGWINPRGVK